MPPKKKKGGKKGPKSAGPKLPKPPPQTETLSEQTRDFYMVQIRDLETRIERYQMKCDELVVQNAQFRERFEQMSVDKKDIVTFLKKSLGQREDEIADLNDRLIGLQQAKDTEKEQYEFQLTQLRTEYQETKDQLTSENMILGGKLASLEEFKVLREDLMAKMTALEQQLQQQEDVHKEEIYNLERKQVVDKDRLKKDMVMRVNQVASEFRKVSNRQMAETTKRTIRENVSISTQLNKMSDKTEDLLQENDELREKDHRQRLQIEMLEDNEKELARKHVSSTKLVQMLTERVKFLEAAQQDYESQEDQHQQRDAEASLLQQQVHATREENESLAGENEQFQSQLTTKTLELRQANHVCQKLERVLAAVSDTLRDALSTSPQDSTESEADISAKREGVLASLLLLLNSAAAIGVGPGPSEFAPDETKKPRPFYSGSMKRDTAPLSPIARANSGTLPHYQLGDLGLVPRPQQHIPTSQDKVKLSESARLGALKRVTSRSIATQTISTAKVMFLADQLLCKLPAEQSARIRRAAEMSTENSTMGPIATPKPLSSKAY